MIATAAPAKPVILPAVTTYAKRVVAGEIVAGLPVRQACERHLRDLQTAHLRGLWFDDEAAQLVVDFVQNVRHSKGEWAGRNLELADWQLFIVGSVFGWKRADGTRRFREVYNELARKNGKTTLLAAVGLYLTIADDEPGAEVYAVATKEDQARIMWSEAVRMAKQTPALMKRLVILESQNNASISWTARNSKFVPLARSSDTQSGLNPHGALVDELHEHKSRNMVDILETALGSRRQPLIWYITTAGWDQSSIWWEKRSYALMVAEGAIEDDSVFVYIATLDKGDDFRDERVWLKANPNLGISKKADKLREDAAKADAQTSRQNAFLRYEMNVPTEQAERWIDLAQWDACDAEPDIRPGRRCFVGLDLASVIDLSAAVALFPSDDGSFDVLPKFWRPDETLLEAEKRDRVPYSLWADEGYLDLVEGSMMDPGDIAERLLAWLSPYQVEEIAYDTWNAAGAAARLEQFGATIVPMTQGPQTYSEPCHTLEGLLLAGRLRHGGNPILRWMAAQVMVMRSANDAMRPFKPEGSGIRDDGITALLMALKRALVHQQVDTTSVYETRGVLRLGAP